MPTVAYTAAASYYQERADLAFDWAEEGTGMYSQRSHAVKAGRNGFAIFGFRGMGTPGYRRLFDYREEGPHESGGMYIFKLPLGQVTVTNATLFFGLSVGYTNGTLSPPFTYGGRIRIYAVACDTFMSRQINPVGYPSPYRSETQPNVWGKPRRYRADSQEYLQPHTEAEVVFTPPMPLVGDVGLFGDAGSAPITSPDLSAMLNEVLSRPGWKYGNTLALVVQPAYQMTPWPPPSFAYEEVSGQNPGSESLLTPSYDSIPSARPRLTITYA